MIEKFPHIVMAKSMGEFFVRKRNRISQKKPSHEIMTHLAASLIRRRLTLFNSSSFMCCCSSAFASVFAIHSESNSPIWCPLTLAARKIFLYILVLDVCFRCWRRRCVASTFSSSLLSMIKPSLPIKP